MEIIMAHEISGLSQDLHYKKANSFFEYDLQSQKKKKYIPDAKLDALKTRMEILKPKITSFLLAFGDQIEFVAQAYINALNGNSEMSRLSIPELKSLLKAYKQEITKLSNEYSDHIRAYHDALQDNENSRLTADQSFLSVFGKHFMDMRAKLQDALDYSPKN
jgi:hypothetical protein